MRKLDLFRLVIVPLTLFTLTFFLSFSTVSAQSLSSHNQTVFPLPHGKVIASGQFQVPIKPDGSVHPDVAICGYLIDAPVRGVMNGQDSIIAEGGFSCNTTYTVATLKVIINGPTVGSFLGSIVFQCPALVSICFEGIYTPYQAGGVWQTQLVASSGFAVIAGQSASAWVSL